MLYNHSFGRVSLSSSCNIYCVSVNFQLFEDLKGKQSRDQHYTRSKCIFSLKLCSALEESANLMSPGSGTGHRVVP